MPCEIIQVRYREKQEECEATMVEKDDAGKELGRVVASSKSIERLKEMLAPANPANLDRIDALLPVAGATNLKENSKCAV